MGKPCYPDELFSKCVDNTVVAVEEGGGCTTKRAFDAFSFGAKRGIRAFVNEMFLVVFLSTQMALLKAVSCGPIRCLTRSIASMTDFII